MNYKRVTDAIIEPLTLTEVKEHLAVDHSDHDSMISSLIKAARHIVENQAQTSLFSQVWLMVSDKFPGGVIELRRGPFVSVDSVEYYKDGVLTTLDPAEYRTDLISKIGRIEPVNSWPEADDRMNAVKVTYTTGYDTVPEDLKDAMKFIIAHHYENRQDVVVGSQVNTVPMTSKYIIDNYRITHVAKQD